MKLNYITIIHTAFLMTEEYGGRKIFDKPEIVGLVNVGEREGTEALEFAYAQTQNMEESWTENNSVATFVEGAEYRSTSVGDRMIFNGDIYRVASMGFQNILDMANENIHALIEEDENHYRGKRLNQ